MKTKITVRSLEDADLFYAAAKELVRKLKSDIAKIDSEESELLFRLHNRKPGAERTSRVAALLGEEVDEGNAAPDGISARLKAIASERVDLRAAIDIAQQRLATARHGASKIICQEISGEYTARVQAVATTLIAAHQAHAELLKLTEELNDREIAWTGYLRPMHATAIFGDDSGRISGWLKDAASAGFLDKKTIPPELVL